MLRSGAFLLFSSCEFTWQLSIPTLASLQEKDACHAFLAALSPALVREQALKMSSGKAADEEGVRSELFKGMDESEDFWGILSRFFVSVCLLSQTEAHQPLRPYSGSGCHHRNNLPQYGSSLAFEEQCSTCYLP